MKNILCGILLLFSFFSIQAAEASNDDTIRISLNPHFPPYSFMDKDGNLEGFDVDMIDAICKRLNRPYEIVLGPLSETLEKLKKKEIDIMFRESYDLYGVDSSVVYGAFNTYCIHSLVVRKNSTMRSESDLAGKTIAVVLHSTAEIYLSTHDHNFRILYCQSYEDALTRVLEKKADAAICNLYTVRYMIKYTPEYSGLSSKVSNLPPLPYYMVANDTDVPLLQDISKALREMEGDGEFDKIYDEWLVKASGKDYTPFINQLFMAIGWTALVALLTLLFFKYRESRHKKIISKKDESLLRSKENMQLLLKDFPLPIYINDMEDGNKLIFKNYAAEDKERARDTDIDLTRTSLEEIETLAKYYDMDVYNTGKSSSFRLHIFIKGVIRPVTVLCNKYPVTMDERKCVLTSYYNVSNLVEEQYRLEEANNILLDAQERAEQVEELKTAFLANMSHEIRTPLNAIEGFSNALVDSQEKAEQKMYANIITSNVELLLKLLKDVLDLSELESKTVKLELSTFNIVDILKEKYYIWNPQFKENSIDFRLVLPSEICNVKFDANRLMQIINNFLSNALKFTEKGYVEMGFEKTYDGGIKVYVKDTGIGIPDDKQEIIGTRFGKANSYKQGMGLGLTICRTIMETAGGEFSFESEEGEGSCFWIVIR